LHLEWDRDLFFDSHKLQTRHAKAAKGSGKRARITLFTPLARDTLRYYLKHVRPHFDQRKGNWLFLSNRGTRLSYGALYLGLKEMGTIARKAGFPIATHMGWHWFRRIFATRFIERFPNRLAVLIDLLGHMSPNTVHRYIRHSEAWMDHEIQSVLKEAERWR